MLSLLLIALSFFIPFSVKALDNPFAGFFKVVSFALKDPFYPDYPQRRILFPLNSLSYWGAYGLSKYTITSKDPKIGNKSVTFYASGSYQCQNGIEMGLPFGNALNSKYVHYACNLTASDDFNFFFPYKPTTTAQTTLNSPAQITSGSSMNATIYLPASWWNY